MMAMPTSGWGMHALQPDYRKETPYLDVYRDFGFAYLEMTSDLDLLTFVVHEEDELSSSPFPSWVPRWDCGADATRFFRTQYQKISNDDDDDDGAILIRNASVLRIRGVIVDSVEYVSRETKDSSQGPAAVEEVVQLWRQVAPQSTEYPGPHQSRLSMAFLAVICRNSYTGDLDEFTRAEQSFAQLLQSDQQHFPLDRYAQDRAAQRISNHVMTKSRPRRLVLLGRGYYGLAARITCQGDACAILYGTQTPCILRKVAGKQGHYHVVGPAYVQSKAVDEDDEPDRLGKNEETSDWKEWDLPTEDIYLR